MRLKVNRHTVYMFKHMSRFILVIRYCDEVIPIVIVIPSNKKYLCTLSCERNDNTQRATSRQTHDGEKLQERK